MIRSAVATGPVDHVLPPEQIPAKPAEYFRNIVRQEEEKAQDGDWQKAADNLGQIHGPLRARTGHDFKNHKERTVVRRVQRLAQHFVREDGTYRVVSELREICLFSQHNLLRDPPCSRLDLLSCRNLLIYLRQLLRRWQAGCFARTNCPLSLPRHVSTDCR